MKFNRLVLAIISSLALYVSGKTAFRNKGPAAGLKSGDGTKDETTHPDN